MLWSDLQTWKKSTWHYTELQVGFFLLKATAPDILSWLLKKCVMFLCEASRGQVVRPQFCWGTATWTLNFSRWCSICIYLRMCYSVYVNYHSFPIYIFFSLYVKWRIHVVIHHVPLLALLPNMETVYRRRNSWAAPWSRNWTSALTVPSQQSSVTWGMSSRWSRRGQTSGLKMMTCWSPMLLWLVAALPVCFALQWALFALNALFPLELPPRGWPQQRNPHTVLVYMQLLLPAIL